MWHQEVAQHNVRPRIGYHLGRQALTARGVAGVRNDPRLPGLGVDDGLRRCLADVLSNLVLEPFLAYRWYGDSHLVSLLDGRPDVCFGPLSLSKMSSSGFILMPDK